MTAKYRFRAVKQTDVRIRVLNEIIQGIQTIKMYAWEQPFLKIIEGIRKYVSLHLVSKFIRSFLNLLFFNRILSHSQKRARCNFHNIRGAFNNVQFLDCLARIGIPNSGFVRFLREYFHTASSVRCDVFFQLFI